MRNWRLFGTVLKRLEASHQMTSTAIAAITACNMGLVIQSVPNRPGNWKSSTPGEV